MKNYEGIVYLSISDLAKAVGVTITTIRNWEEYEKELGYQILPQPRRDLDKKGSRYYKYEDIAEFKEFQNNIKWGDLAKVSCRKWGARGEKKRK